MLYLLNFMIFVHNQSKLLMLTLKTRDFGNNVCKPLKFIKKSEKVYDFCL